MHSILDTSLINSPDSEEELTREWENECDIRNSPKIKFPLKIIDDSVGLVDLNFTDPKVSEPEEKKKDKNPNSVKVVSLGNKKQKDKKKNLF